MPESGSTRVRADAASRDHVDILSTPEAGPAAIRGGVLRVASYVLGTLLSVVAAALLFRHLGVVNTGRYVTVLTLVSMVQALTEAGLTAMGVREMSNRDQSERDRLMANLLALRLVLTVIGVAGAVVFCVAAGYEPVLVLGTALAGVGLLLANVQTTLAIDLMSRMRFGLISLIEIFRQAFTTAVIVGLVLVGAQLIAFLAVPIPAGAAILLLTLFAMRGRIRLGFATDRPEWRRLLRETAPFAVGGTLWAIYFRLAVLFVSIFATAKELGYFGASFRVLDVLLLIPGMAISAAFPIFSRAARDDHDRLAYVLQRTFDTMTIFGVWFGVVVAVGAPVAIDIVAGARFREAVPILQIQAVGLVAGTIATTFSSGMLSLGHRRQTMILSTAAFLVGATVTGVCTAAFGGQGAAAGIAASEIIFGSAGGILLFWLNPALRPSFRVVAPVALATGLALSPALLGLAALPATVVGSILYFACLFALRAIPEELMEHLGAFRRLAIRT
jgi:O-antigen/teichoic acid export membrane protein